MRYRRSGVKREHSVIDGFAPVYERLARLPGVDGVIPGRIADNPTRHPGLVLKTETATGYKLLAKTTSSIQEVFVMARGGGRATVLEGLRGLVTRPLPPGGAARGGQRSHARGPGTRVGTAGPRTPRPGRRPWRNPGVLPEGRLTGDVLRYSVGTGGQRGAWTPARLGESLRDEGVRRRLLVLRLRRARWRRRFGAPRRAVPRPRRTSSASGSWS